MAIVQRMSRPKNTTGISPRRQNTLNTARNNAMGQKKRVARMK